MTGVELTVKKLFSPHVFEIAAPLTSGMRSCLTCTRFVYLHTELKLRQEAALVLRKVNWLVIIHSVADPLLDCSVLEPLGLHTRELLAAVADTFSRAFNIELLIALLPKREMAAFHM